MLDRHQRQRPRLAIGVCENKPADKAEHRRDPVDEQHMREREYQRAGEDLGFFSGKEAVIALEKERAENKGMAFAGYVVYPH